MPPANEKRKGKDAQRQRYDAFGLFYFVNVGTNNSGVLSICVDVLLIWQGIGATYARKYERKAMNAEASSAPTQSTFVFKS